MSLVPYRSVFDDELFDKFFAPKAVSKADFFSPRVDIKENNNHFAVTAELPGVKKEDLHIHLENGVLSIEAETKQEKKEEDKGKVVRQERRYGSFYRSFSVGNNIKESDIEANYVDGVLSLTFPKNEPTSPARKKIEIT